MKWFGLVFEQLTHDDERQRTERRHLQQRRAARFEARQARRELASAPAPTPVPGTPATGTRRPAGAQRPAGARAVPWSGA